MNKQSCIIFLSIFISCTTIAVSTVTYATEQTSSRAVRVVPFSGTAENGAIPSPDQTKGIPVTDFELVVQAGHAGAVQAVAMGPAGKYFVSGSADKTIKIWTLESGILLRTIPVFYAVSALVIDASGQLVYTANSENGDITVFRLTDGQRMTNYRGKREIYSLALTPDGRQIVTGSGDGHIQVRDVNSGMPVLSISTGKMTGVYFQIYALAVSPDGQLMATNGLRGDIMIWHLQTGELIHTLKGHNRVVQALVISPDSQHLVSAGSDNSIRIWQLHSGRLLHTLNGHPADKYSAIQALAIDPAGQTLLSGDSHGNVLTWDMPSGEQKSAIQAHQDGVRALAFDPVGQYFVTASKDHTLKVFDFLTGQLARKLIHGTFSMTAVAWHPTERYLVAGGSDNVIRIWNLNAGRLHKTLSGHRGRIGSLAVDPTGHYIISGGWDQTIRIWEFATGKPVHVLKGHEGRIRALQLDSRGKLIISGGDDRSIRLWSLSSGELLYTFNGHSGPISSLCLDPSDRYLVSGAWDRTLRIWDLKERTLLNTMAPGATGGFGGATGHSGPVLALTMDPQGRFFVSSALDRTAKFWELNSGELLHTMKWNDIGVSIRMDPKRMRLISGSLDGKVKVWDIETEDAVAVLENDSTATVIDSNQMVRFEYTGFDDMTAVNDVAVSPDGNRILAANQNGSIKLWDLRRDSHITFVSAADEWVMFNPDGFFDASGSGGDVVPMVQGMTVFGIDQFALRNNRPDVILKTMGLGTDQIHAHLHNYYLRRLKKIGLSPEQLSGDLHVPQAAILESNQVNKQVHLLCEFSDTRMSLKKYNIYVNDVPLYGIYGKDISGSTAVVNELIDLNAGRNKIEATCINSAGLEAYRALAFFDYREPVKGDLYFVGFGCSRYRDSRLNLRYAHKDVSDLANTFKQMVGAFHQVHIRTYVNDQVTAGAFNNVRELLKQAAVDDTVVLFIAGHGVHDVDPDLTYYYLTHNAVLEDLKSTALDFEFIERLLVDIAPRKKLFLIDTCESGELDEQSVQRTIAEAGDRGMVARSARAVRVVPRGRQGSGPIDRDRYIYNELLRRSGAIVFSSSRGDELSYESDRLQNGYFTEQLIKGLSTDGADENRDQMISSDELRRFVADSVFRMSHGLQHPTVDRDNIYQKIFFPVVDADH